MIFKMIFGKKDEKDDGDTKAKPKPIPKPAPKAKVKGGGKINVAGLQAKVKELERQNEIMRNALEFYADVNSWQVGHKYVDNDNATIFMDSSESSIDVDKGSRAHRALESCKS